MSCMSLLSSLLLILSLTQTLAKSKIEPDVVWLKTPIQVEPNRTKSEDKHVDASRTGTVKSPFFFLCHSPRQGEPAQIRPKDLTLKLELKGERNLTDGYEPHSVYEVLLTSSMQLDAILLTAVHSLTKKFTEANHLHLPSSSSSENSAGNVCTVLHSHISKKPKSKLSFMWMSPPSGTGCVSLIVTGSLQNRLLFKDIMLKKVCEKGLKFDKIKALDSVKTLGGADQGFIFKDDFEDGAIDPAIWHTFTGGKMETSKYSQQPGTVLAFNSGSDSLIETRAMDFTKSQQLQYTLGMGGCNKNVKVRLSFGYAVKEIDDISHGKRIQATTESRSALDLTTNDAVSTKSSSVNSGETSTETSMREDRYGLAEVSTDYLTRQRRSSNDLDFMSYEPHLDPSQCHQWKQVDILSISEITEVHTRGIPNKFRRDRVCIKWETMEEKSSSFPDQVGQRGDELNDECWTLDNVAVVTRDDLKGPISDDFDPVDPINWIFFPGGEITESCNSEGSALTFEGNEESWVTTRQVDFSHGITDKDVLLREDFKSPKLKGWIIEGGGRHSCDHGSQKLLTFIDEGERRICSPKVDGRKIGVVLLEGGVRGCGDDEEIKIKVSVQVNISEVVPLKDFTFETIQEHKSIIIPSHLKHNGIRICLSQEGEKKEYEASWTIQKVQLLPWMPVQPEHFFQAQMNLKCGYDDYEVDVEASSDGGNTWYSLHPRCIPGSCHGGSKALSTIVSEQLDSGWSLVTLPLPYSAMAPNSRIRVRQLQPGNSIKKSRWAIDNVFIGKCPEGCNNRGLCQKSGICRCQYGYKGTSCGEPEVTNPFYISEPFTGNIENSANILKISGGKGSYQCGVVGRGPAAVFTGSGPRFLTTVDVNTTEAAFLQFHFQAGTHSDIGRCPGPNDENESIFVHYSCTGGAKWTLLYTLHAKDHKKPSHISLPLPAGSRGPSCRFQVWQDEHSGLGKDMWAVDDLTVTSQIFNVIELTFDDITEANNSLRFHQGRITPFCDQSNAITFDGYRDASSNFMRFLETKSINIGPSYMMQFDLVIGCQSSLLLEESDSTVVLEYSLNHGLRWNLVQRPCSPSKPGCETHFTRGTVYHVSEFYRWKRVTLVLPQRTWSPTTRLRLRQLEDNDNALPWAVDNLYIGHKCEGFCSGHGQCTSKGCKCDAGFHGYKCFPLNKLQAEIDADFDEDDDLAIYNIHLIGGTLVSRSEGCGPIVSGKSVYFGSPGVRQFETDDLNAANLRSIMFHLAIGGGHVTLKSCLPASKSPVENVNERELSFGSVVLEFSTDGGISWELLRELLPESYRKPSAFKIKIEEEVLEKADLDSGVIRFRIWQPKHGIEEQWAIDNFKININKDIFSLQADFKDGAMLISPWLTVTQHSQEKYCSSEDITQVMNGADPLRLALTNPLALNEGDVITFQISVGCMEDRNYVSPVRFEYSRQGSFNWQLVQDECNSMSPDCEHPQEPSIYWPGHHGPWINVYIPVDHTLSHGTIQLRWIQENPSETKDGAFALQKIYIGRPCLKECHGHGMCTSAGWCRCESDYSGKFCGKTNETHSDWLRDDFDTSERSPYWDRIEGAKISAGCGQRHHGKVLLFSGEGPRFLTTKELDTRRIKYLVFNLQIGGHSSDSHCSKGVSPRDNVVLEYTSNNALTWNLLREFEPYHTTMSDQPFFIALPFKAKSKRTRFRWWQIPHNLYGTTNIGEQAEWQLDNVMVLANETLPTSIADINSTESSYLWFLIVGGKHQNWKNRESPLVFSGHNVPNYAETWDFETSSATIVQFDLLISSEDRKAASEIHLEFSSDNGQNWHLVRDLSCLSPVAVCDGYHMPTVYSSNVITNWTRITVPLSKSVMGERTRLRFTLKGERGGPVDPASSWGIDNVYIGDSCPWMCSGHGYCGTGTCRCDEDYFGEFCVPAKVLTCEALDNFDPDSFDQKVWLEIQGAEVSSRCGALVSKSALVFFKNGHRFATTVDLDMTAGRFVQFTLLMGCKSHSHHHHEFDQKKKSQEVSSILVQYSTNGGITWVLLEELEYRFQVDPIFVSIRLDDFSDVRSNATRFRFWQPAFELDTSEDVWAIDSVFIGGLYQQPNVLFDDLNGDVPHRDAWIDWPAGQVESFCSKYSSRSSIVFKAMNGQHALYTRDMAVDKSSVLQFDIKVGCGNSTMDSHNVTLRFSTNFGKSWETLRPPCHPEDSLSQCLHELQTPTVYYTNAAPGWTRVIIPLSCLNICGNVRFSWWQGYYHPKETSEEWAIDNVFIGPACDRQCMGHGYCINGDMCDCDDNFDSSDVCTSGVILPKEIREGFEEGELAESFVRWSGSDVSNHCEVITGRSLLFWRQGERMLITKDLDLTDGSVVQFYIREGCANPWDDLQVEAEDYPDILLQYSTNGGVHWDDLAKVPWDAETLNDLPKSRFFSFSLPEASKTNATRLRWWQPSKDGIFETQWAIDQILITSSSLSLTSFYDGGLGTPWLLRPGSNIHSLCGSKQTGVHFSSSEGTRFAETPDIITTERTFIQFEIAMGCETSSHCFDVVLEYSLDHGKTWHLVKEECLPSDINCPDAWHSSILSSDLYREPSQVIMSIPIRARAKTARFRFKQPSPWRPQHAWTLGRIYIGDECHNRCHGRGFCVAGVCRCHEGWSGSSCDEGARELPKFVADDFTVSPSSERWEKIVGGKISTLCGPIASGSALHFYGSCNRLIETVDLDLRGSLFVQFDLRTGCLDPVYDSSSSGDNSILVQISCNAGGTWNTIKRLPLSYHTPKYIWMEIPEQLRCYGGRVRWWQPGSDLEANKKDWALDAVVVGGASEAPFNITLIRPTDLTFPLWLRGYNAQPGQYCDFEDEVQVLESTPSESAVVQSTDIQITMKHSLHFNLALGCGALWDNNIEPVRLEYSKDFGRHWHLLRELCLPFNSTTCKELHDESVFYAPQKWRYYVFPMDHLAPYKYTRFRWIQYPTSDIAGSHKWALRDVFIGLSCLQHCLGRGSCIDGVCHCEEAYSGDHCQDMAIDNVPYIKDTFEGPVFLDHWLHLQGTTLGSGCGGEFEEPPVASFQGSNTRSLMSRPVDTRSARFVLFSAHIGSHFGNELCRRADERIHNVFLQYSVNGGINWHLLRELDYNIYVNPTEDYLTLPRHAMSPATIFRFWQPRLVPSPPAWSLDNVFIGGSEIPTAQMTDSFVEEPTVSEWLFAPHSQMKKDYCEVGHNASLVWEADHPGHRAITTQEFIVSEGHVLQFKISVGCEESKVECYSGPKVHLEYSKDGGASGWELVLDTCFPETSADPDCFPYTFHGQSIYGPDLYPLWTRIMIPLPEKTWSSTTQLRWVQNADLENGQVKRVLPWSLDDVHLGTPCQDHCRGHGDCEDGLCVCDPGYHGPSCEPDFSRATPLPSSLIDGFEGGLGANWASVTGGGLGLGCNSLSPYGHGKHLYFGGCGVRQAITKDLDTRAATKVMFVLRIGSHDNIRSCRVDLTDPKRVGDKGVVLQYSSDNGVLWHTINVHDPLDFRKAKRVAYSLPFEARQVGVKLRWWQPDHDGMGTDQWAIDNVEIVLAQRKSTDKYQVNL